MKISKIETYSSMNLIMKLKNFLKISEIEIFIFTHI